MFTEQRHDGALEAHHPPHEQVDGGQRPEDADYPPAQKHLDLTWRRRRVVFGFLADGTAIGTGLILGWIVR